MEEGSRVVSCVGVVATYRLQKKYKRYIQIGIEGRKNCLVAGIKQTNSEIVGMPILTRIGMGAITSEKIMKPAMSGYWISNHPHLCRCMARTPSRGLKDLCNLVISVVSS